MNYRVILEGPPFRFTFRSMKPMDLLKCFTGPEMYKRYRVDAGGQPLTYNANILENYSGTVITVMRVCYHIGVYMSPFIVMSLYRRGLTSSTELVVKVGVAAALLYGTAIFFRGVGRMINRDYLQFITVLNLTLTDPASEAYKRLLRQYDFDFRHWPVEYSWHNELNGEVVKPRRFLPVGAYQATDGSFRQTMKNALCYFAVHTFGRRLMYPGSLWIIQAGVWPALLDGRTKLVEQKDGKRYKLKTSLNTSVDCMFVDRRNNPHYPNGNTLVVTCEGNAAFYEIGCGVTPLDAGYSVLGWNHPGFGGSTGVPLPDQECAAADVVLQFATNRLGFKEEDVAMFAWSIGGFVASWVGMNYRNVKALIMDATFDDVLPLALRVMPTSWSPLVEQTVRTYINLHISEQLRDYDGPVLFYRRTKDEILSTDDSSPEAQRRSNRGNELLKKFLSFRYPEIFNNETLLAVNAWLHGVDAGVVEEQPNASTHDEEYCVEILSKYFTTHGVSFPTKFGERLDRNSLNKLALFLAKRHLLDFDSTHCVPLPGNLFKIPKHPWEILID